MAFYSSDFHEHTVEYNHFYCNGCYDFSPARSSIGFSSYEIHDPRYIPYDGSYYNHAASRASVVSSAYSLSQPEFSTQYIVSYCNTESNEPESEDEYDPQPYVSGYDIHQTYGKPLSPSDEICYPRSGSDPNAPRSVNGFSYGSAVAPYGKDENDENIKEPSNGSMKIEEGQQSYTSERDQDEEEPPNSGDVNNYYPLHDSALERLNEDYDKQVRQIPPGYGLEAFDLCEGMFGYWPCLARRDRRNHDRRDHDYYDNGGAEGNCWQSTADYLFGNPYPYGGMMVERGSYGDPVYSYERHCQQQALVQQVEYDDDDDGNDDEYSNLRHSQYYEA